MDEIFKIIKNSQFITKAWSGGKTTELFIYPQTSSYEDRDFEFRISSASVELDESQFTKLDGINRFICPLDGELRLTHDGKEFIDLKAFEVYNFKGGENTNSYGKVRDFNLMLKDGVKGKLESIKIKDEIYLLDDIRKFEIFYSYEGSFKFRINEDEFTLNANELVIVDTGKFTEDTSINIHSQGESWILRSSISL